MAGRVLVTGADGYVARGIVARLLSDTDRSVIMFVRAADDAERAGKEQRIADMFPGVGADRIAIVFGDLRDPDPFSTIDPADVQAIVHGGAVVRFNVEPDLAQAVNIAGTERTVAFARACADLDSFVLLSSLYASGLAPGIIPEAPCDDAFGFANYYESSKWHAEQCAYDAAATVGLPVRVMRFGVVIADDDSGRVSVPNNAFHNTLKLAYYGLLPLVPGIPDTPLYLATRDVVAAAAVQLCERSAPLGVFHCSHRREDAVTLGGLMDISTRVFEESPVFRSRGLERPPFADHEAFAALAKATDQMRGSVMGQSLGSLTPFAPQMYVMKDVQTERAQGAFAALDRDPAALVDATARWLVATRWGADAPAGSAVLS